jgi:PAS domain S-box-containing protein
MKSKSGPAAALRAHTSLIGMTQVPDLLQLLADARIGLLFAAAKPALVLDRDGKLLFANRASLALLRTDTRRKANAAIAAERGPFTAALRGVSEAPADAAPQLHTLPIRIGTTRRPIQFACSRLDTKDGRSATLLVGLEPVGSTSDTADSAAAAFGDEAQPFALFGADGKKIYANTAAASLIGGASGLTEILPGSQNALSKARSEGGAELSFGVLRIVLRRIGTESDPLVAAAFLVPARSGAAQGAEAIAPAPHTETIPKPVVEAEPAPIPAAPVKSTTASASLANEKSVSEGSAEKELLEPDATPEAPEAPKAEPATASEAVTERETEAPAEAVPTEPIEAQKEPPRLPSRFVWQTDADGRFTSVSPELAIVVGKAFAAVAGMDWSEAGKLIGIDGTSAVAKAVARRDTWSGVTVHWPIDGIDFLRPVELAALPAFDRERHFLGYRGFGVFRDPVPRPAAPSKPVAPEPSEPENLVEEPTPKKPVRGADFDLPDEPPVFGKRPEKVVSLHKPASETPSPGLSPVERNAFREIARAIGTRMNRVDGPAFGKLGAGARPQPQAGKADSPLPARTAGDGERAVLDRLPIGVVVHRNDRILYANRTLLDWLGLANVKALETEGGLARLFSDGQSFGSGEIGETRGPIAIRGRGNEPIPVEARLVSAPWEGEAALVYVLRRAGSGIDERIEAGELALRDAEAVAREMRAILDTATDGVALLDRDGHVLGMNRSAEALFGFDSAEIEGRNFAILFAPESHRAAMDYLDGLATNGVASVLNDGREVIGRVREGGLIPLFMTLGRIDEAGQKFCAVFRDITQWKRAEEELVHARRQAERANSAKSEFLAKISHEIRTPLNAIIGFAEVMMEERLGPIGNERYREYLKDIHTSGEHLVSLINDLLDLSKIEAGKLDLNFSSVDLNEIASQSMALMQPQANRERIIIRTALSPDLPPVVADTRSIRQIVLNLLSNSIRFTPPGGQVIVSTSLTDEGEVHLRVRDTGIGMTENEIKTALEPFRQIATSGRGKDGGTGLGLPLTKALVEANRASFTIKSTVNAGTLVEIAFPSTRVLAE